MNSLAHPGNRSRSGWWAGIWAALLATVALGVARILLDVPTPPELLADVVIGLFPPAIFSASLDLLGGVGKPLLTMALLAGETAIGGLAGAATAWLLRQIEATTDTSRAGGLSGLLGLAGWLTVLFILLPIGGEGFFGLTSPPGPFVTMLSYLGVAAVFAAGLGYFLVRPNRPPRRLANRRAALAALGASVVGAVGFALGRKAIGPLESGSPPAAVPGPITPVPSFYIVHKNLFPVEVDLARWSLTVDGAERTAHLSLGDLQAMPVAEVVSTLTCISNPVGGNLIGTARWTGVHLGDLLQIVGHSENATEIVLRAWDDYAESVPIVRALQPTTVLAYAMDDQPLRPEHGAPLRLIVPGLYGIKNVKWITRISLSDHGFVGYWPARGWTDQAIVQTQSQIDVPADRSVHPLGQISVGGIAFAGDRGISRVELSTDDGQTWQPARLMTPLTPLAWTVWSYAWQPTRADLYRLSVRATDGAGNLQTASAADPIPDGATGYHSISVRVG